MRSFFLVIILTTSILFRVSPGAYTVEVTVYFVDVGQGDGIIIDTPEKDALIDAGTRRRGGESVLTELVKAGITRLDYIIATHPDSDHIQGLITVMEKISPVNSPVVIDSGQMSDTQTYADYIAQARMRQIVTAVRGQNFTLAPNVVMFILNPTQPLQFDDSNENSIVIRLDVGKVSFMLTGDCEIGCEKSILDAGLKVESQILKVGHHGSRSASSPEFLDAAKPEVAIISAGLNNRYGHPHPEVIQALVARGVYPYSTAQDGTLVVKADEKTYRVLGSPTPIPEFPTPMIALTVVLLGLLFVMKKLRSRSSPVIPR